MSTDWTTIPAGPAGPSEPDDAIRERMRQYLDAAKAGQMVVLPAQCDIVPLPPPPPADTPTVIDAPRP